MKFVAEAKDVTEALKLLNSVSGDNTETIIFGCNDDRISITAYNDTRIATALVKAEISKTGKFAIDPNIITGLVKNRGKLEFIVAESLAVTQQGTKYSVSEVPLKSTDKEPLKFKNKESLPASLSQKIQASLSDCMIKKVISDDIFFVLSRVDDYINMAVADNFHAALVTLKLDKAELTATEGFKSLVLPLEYAEMLSKMSGGANISTDGGTVSFMSDSFRIDLPALATKPIDLSEMVKLTRSMFKEATVMDTEGLKDFANNIAPLADSNISILTNFEGKQASFSYTTSRGKVTDSVEAKVHKTSETLKLDVSHLLDISKKLKGVMRIGWNDYCIGFYKAEEGKRVAYYLNLK